MVSRVMPCKNVYFKLSKTYFEISVGWFLTEWQLTELTLNNSIILCDFNVCNPMDLKKFKFFWQKNSWSVFKLILNHSLLY